jgi:hypothetical protein
MSTLAGMSEPRLITNGDEQAAPGVVPPSSPEPDGGASDVQFLDQVSAELTAAEAALARLEDGTYWTCEQCGRPIEAAALEGDPLLARCSDHAG